MIFARITELTEKCMHRPGSREVCRGIAVVVRTAQLHLQPRELIDCRWRLRGLRKQCDGKHGSRSNGSRSGNHSCKSVHRASLPIF